MAPLRSPSESDIRSVLIPVIVPTLVCTPFAAPNACQARKEAEEWKPRLDAAQTELFKLERALELKVNLIDTLNLSDGPSAMLLSTYYVSNPVFKLALTDTPTTAIDPSALPPCKDTPCQTAACTQPTAPTSPPPAPS